MSSNFKFFLSAMVQTTCFHFKYLFFIVNFMSSKKIPLQTLLFVICFVGYLLIPRANAEVIDRVLASIDGDPVTEDEIREILTIYFFSEGKSGSETLKDMDESLLKEALIGMLFEREAKRLNLKVSIDDINSYISQVERANNAQEGSLMVALEEQGISFEMYQKKVRSEMLRSKVLTAELRSKIQVSDEEVDEYIGRSSEEENGIEQKDVFSLMRVSFINRLQNEEADAKERMEEIRNTLFETKSCASISKSGALCENLGPVKLADLKNDLQDMLRKKSIYEPAEIITQGDEVVFYFKAPKTYSKEKSQVKEEIRQKLFQDRFQEAAEKYLKEDIFTRYHVEIHESK
jgi:peptidyl-prolyl cis-trans isomerase SurA